MLPDIHKLNRFIIRVARSHMGHKELSSSSMDYRQAGLALIEQGISDTLMRHGSEIFSKNCINESLHKHKGRTSITCVGPAATARFLFLTKIGVLA
jgi:hypothetical protein